jgi:hypothetical protein
MEKIGLINRVNLFIPVPHASLPTDLWEKGPCNTRTLLNKFDANFLFSEMDKYGGMNDDKKSCL